MSAITVWLLFLLMPMPAAAGRPPQKTLLSAQSNPDLRAIVDAERAFAGEAAKLGIRDSFLAFLADDAVLFRPGPVPGRKWLQEHPPAAGLLSWQPVFADISAAGDLGYTTGPYEFRKQAADSTPASYGNYFTIWKKQPDNSWKVLIDFGTSNPAPARPAADFDPAQAAAPAPSAATAAQNLPAKLIGLDEETGRAAAASGIRALRPSIAAGARFLQAGMQPAVGDSEVFALLDLEPGIRSWTPLKAGASLSGDLGYTYGSFTLQHEKKSPSSGYYLRVWKRQPAGDWKIAAEFRIF